MPGIVYLLTNPAMPDYVKIGHTADLDARLRALDNTSVPLPFEVVFAVEVDDPEAVERLLHQTFADRRTRHSREFFEVGEQRVVAAIRLTGGRDVTPAGDVVEDEESQVALNAARARREAFNFDMVGIPPGTELVFWDEPKTVCVVASKKTVRFREEEMSMSAAARAILIERDHYGDWIRRPSSVQGTKYWYLQGESMAERRDRMEAEG